MKQFCIVTALIELGAGVALVFFPSATVALLVGEPLAGPAALTVARIGGAAITSLGVACWLARRDAHSPAARGLVVAMLLYNVATVALLVFASSGYGLTGLALWPGVGLHVVMAVWCGTILRRST